MVSPYVMRETGGNLVRNIVMTFAAIVTMAVSLTALGGVMVMRQAVNKATVQWQGGVQVAIFMGANATGQEIGAIRHELDGLMPTELKSCKWMDKEQAYQEFKTIFADQPDLVRVMSPAQMPPSFRCVPAHAQDASQVASQFENQPGVFQVRYAQQAIRQTLAHFTTLRNVALVLAAAVMLGAIALVVNTIQMAIFARRREISVMKLVGATNWFIRIPFMLEGLVQGLVGALVAFLVTFFARSTFTSFTGVEPLVPGEHLFVTSHEALLTGLFILLAGTVLGVAGSGFAVRRFLAV